MRVRFFASCLVEMLRPEVGAAAERVLRAAGHEPEPVRGATCCGQPAYNAGYAAEARRVARRTLRALDRDDLPCVVASGSCATMMAHHWPELFEGTPEAGSARRVAARTRELTVYLAETAAAGDPAAPPDPALTADPPRDAAEAEPVAGPVAGTQPCDGDRPATGPAGRNVVVVHDSCHALRELGAGDTVPQALRAAGHVPVSPAAPERCCGFGGSFSVKLPAVSVAMADEKLDNLAAAGGSQVTACDLSCLVHLQGRARRRGLDLRFDHVASLLDPGT